MANEKNLIPFNQLTESEQRKIASSGGKASGEARRKRKAFKELFEAMLDEDGGNLNGQKATRKEVIAARALKLLIEDGTTDKDFLKAFEVVRDTIGEKPVDKVMVSEVDQDTIDEVERLVLGND